MEEADGNGETRLREYLISQIRKKGPIPFSEFMTGCLYHPSYGYYLSGKARIGKEGDYYTSSCVGPLFGRLIAKQLIQMAEILGDPSFDVLEMGGGRGFLCNDILDRMKEDAPSLYGRSHYFVVERAARFRKEQQERLSAHEGRVTWVDPGDFESGRIPVAGCILSNELVDSFPVHRVVSDRGHLKEIYVACGNNGFEEVSGEVSDPALSEYFRSMEIVLEDGQKAEVNLEALRWMEQAGRLLTRGFVLTVDYGDVAQALYVPERREGTLRCYFEHRLSGNPFERVGRQDITSHVNFTSLIRKGEEAGLRLTGLVPQYRFLIALGILEEAEEGAGVPGKQDDLDRLKQRLALKHLIETEVGMGEAFKVLIQHKGIEAPKLHGLRELNEIPERGSA